MRRELSDAVTNLLDRPLPLPRPLDETERDRLITLTTFAVRARSAVERDGYSREIELIPDPEAPTRLIIVLERLLAGIDIIGADRTEAWRIVTKVALDSIPATRRAVIDLLAHADDEVETPKVAEELGYPTATAKRALEDVTAHGIARRVTRGSGKKADTWKLTQWAMDRYAACNSEMSSNTRSGRDKRTTDISESPGAPA